MADLPAGRDLDALVAKVLGIEPRDVRVAGSTEYVSVYTNNPAISDGIWTDRELRLHGAPRPYSTDPAAAIEALEAWANADDSRWFRIIRDDVFGRRCYIVELDASSDEWMAQAPTLAHAAALALVTASPAETSH